jgi:alpha-glucoside transport system substrate-binding protein
MHRQASFATAFFPDDVEVGQDADFFYFPAFAEKDLGSPVLGGGTLMAITSPNEATMEFMNFLKTPIAHEVMMAQTGFLTPHTGVSLDAYKDDILRGQGQILLDATTFRFDGSDLMPGAVGAGSFWTGMVDYVGGADVGDVTDSIQRSWDALK